MTNVDYSKLKINQIADIIAVDWKNISPHAIPYLSAMQRIENIDDIYGQDDAESILMYFLSNTHQWKGEKAKEIKKYLNKLINKI